MKKSIILFCCIAAVFSLAMQGCAGGNSGENTKKGKPLALVLEGTMKGFVDTDGALAIDLSDYLYAVPFSEGLAAVKNGDGRWGFIDTKGKEVIPCKFECDNYRYHPMFHKGYAFMDGVGLIDRKGNVVVQAPYIEEWNKEVVVVSNSEYYTDFSLFDMTGEQITNEEYKRLCLCDNGMVLCQTRSGWGYLDSKGNIVVEPKYKEAYLYEDGLALVIDDDNKATLIDEKGKVKKTFDHRPSLRGRCDDRNFYEGFAIAHSDDGFTGHNVFVNSRYEQQFDKVFGDVSNFRDGYAAVQDMETELWGFIDRKGNYVVESQYKGYEAMACDDGYGIVYGSSGVIVVNIKKGTDVRVPSVYNIVAERMWVKLTDVRDANGWPHTLYGILTPDGQEIMPPSQYKVVDFHYTESDNSTRMSNCLISK